MVRSAENAIALQNRRKEVFSFSPCLMSRAKMPYGLATEKLLPRFSKARKVTEQHKAFWGKYGVDTGKPHLSGLGGAGKLSEEKPGQSCRSYLQQILQAILRPCQSEADPGGRFQAVEVPGYHQAGRAQRRNDHSRGIYRLAGGILPQSPQEERLRKHRWDQSTITLVPTVLSLIMA